MDGEFPGGPVVRIWCFHCRGPGSIPDRGTEIPQAAWCGQKKKCMNKMGQKEMRVGKKMVTPGIRITNKKRICDPIHIQEVYAAVIKPSRNQ